MKIDKVDLKLINILGKNGRMPLNHLAREAFLSSPAVSSRMEKLEKNGVITGYQAKINHQKLGYHITAFINLEMDPQLKPKFYPFIQECHNVLECNCVTGSYSMLIKVAFKSTQDLDAFINRLQEFGSTSTQIVFSTPVEPRSITYQQE